MQISQNLKEVLYSRTPGDVIHTSKKPSQGHNGVEKWTRCFFCSANVRKPKYVPCIHKTCLKCLIEFGKDKQPGWKEPCPICKQEVVIPFGGFRNNSSKTSYVEKILDIQKREKAEEYRRMTCDVCSTCDMEYDKSTKEPKKGTWRCEECQQNMCDQCSKLHSAMRVSRDHQISSTVTDLDELLKSTGGKCDQHPSEKLKIYCLECMSFGCVLCFFLENHRHSCDNTKTKVKIRKKQTIRNMKIADKLSDGVDMRLKVTAKQFEYFDDSFDLTRSEILKRSEELKHLIELKTQTMLEELNSQKLDHHGRLDSIGEQLQKQKASLVEFRKESQQVLDENDSLSLIRSADDLFARSKNLLEDPPVEIRPQTRLSVVFPDSKSLVIDDDRLHTFGRISTETHKAVLYDQLNKVHSVNLNYLVCGLALLDKQLFVLFAKSEIHVFNRFSLNFERHIIVTGMKFGGSMTICGNSIFASEAHNDEDSRIFQIRLPEDTISSWIVDFWDLTLTTTRTHNILALSNSSNKLIEYTPSGERIRETRLPSSMSPHHAIHMKNDTFLVCHSGPGEEIYKHQVSMLDKSGRIIRSFPRECHSELQFDFAIHMNVDSNGFIVVADLFKNRIVLLNAELEFVKELYAIPHRFEPIRVCLDEENRRLHVVTQGAEMLTFDTN